MTRRTLLTTAASAAAAMALPVQAQTAPFKGKIRKCLKWGMVKEQSLPLPEAFRKLKACGYEGVEPSFKHVKDADAWLAASKETGLVIDCIVGAGEQDLNTVIDLAKKLGGDSILVTTGYDHKKTWWDNWKESQARIKAAGPHGEKQGIKVLIENVWASFLISPLDMQRYVEEINHPSVGVHYDVGNVMRWGVAEHWIQVIGKHIGKLDIKEYDLGVAMKEGMSAGFKTPIGEGSINWAAVREELGKINYTGWAAAEVAGGDWDYLADVARRMDKVLGLV